MNKRDQYRLELNEQTDLETYLLTQSGLPGPRSNLELMHTAVDFCTEAQLRSWLSVPEELAPENTPQVFLSLIGVVGLGRLILADQKETDIQRLRKAANDSRWRIREATAMALQRIGFANPALLTAITTPWLEGTLHELRAVAAAWAEPGLLKSDFTQKEALRCMDLITLRYLEDTQSDKEACRILKKGLEYAWSVVVAANLPAGKPLFEKWFFSSEPIQKIMLVNLTKNRLIKADPDWVSQLTRRTKKEG